MELLLRTAGRSRQRWRLEGRTGLVRPCRVWRERGERIVVTLLIGRGLGQGREVARGESGGGGRGGLGGHWLRRVGRHSRGLRLLTVVVREMGGRWQRLLRVVRGWMGAHGGRLVQHDE